MVLGVRALQLVLWLFVVVATPVRSAGQWTLPPVSTLDCSVACDWSSGRESADSVPHAQTIVLVVAVALVLRCCDPIPVLEVSGC